MSPKQGALRRQALVMAVAFSHHAAQEKAAPEPRRKIAGRELDEVKNEERRGGQ